MSGHIFTLIGGNGFIGRHLAEKLLKNGHTVRIAARQPRRGMDDLAQRYGNKISFHTVNIHVSATLLPLIEDSYGVVNLVGILHEGRTQGFMDTQAEAAGEIAELAYENGVGRYVHVSAIGANKAAASLYAQSKAIGEINVSTAYPMATILRPSLVVGKGDGFFGRFSRMARMNPLFLGFTGGEVRFQPVQVDDVVKAIEASLTGVAPYEGIYELGGPRIYTFRRLLEMMLEAMGKKRIVMDMPLALARPMAAVLELFPNPMLTRDQLHLLAHDNVVTEEAMGFDTLGITPQPIEDIIKDASL